MSEPKPKTDRQPLGARKASQELTVQRIVGAGTKTSQVDVAAFQSFAG